MMSYRALSPGPSPSGGGCRPQGRRESENVAGPRCGNDRSRGDMRTVLPSAGGHVLPLPSSASRGIGGCHLPPLGEGRGGCGFAWSGGLTLGLLRGTPRTAFPTERARIRRTWRLVFGVAAGASGRRPLQNKVPSPIPSPSGGGCRPQGRRERENVAGPRCGNDRSRGIFERFYRLQAVRFSLFRHPPRGGSAAATFPRWGKEMGNVSQKGRFFLTHLVKTINK